MMLHIIYRSYGGENRKARPSFYSKELALASMLRAAAKLQGYGRELIFVNDGPIPASLLERMQAAGEIISGAALGNKGSLRIALRLAKERRWSAQDLLWIAEDDYLYQEDALTSLVAAADGASSYQYFGLYGLIGNRQPNGRPHIDCRVPHEWSERDRLLIGDRAWRTGLSTTSTFGVRVDALRRDHFMTSVGMETGGAFDHSICLAYQHYRPFPRRFLSSEMQRACNSARAAMISIVRSVFNIYISMRQRYAGGPHALLVADPALITHMEEEHMAVGSDWTRVAEDVTLYTNGL